MPRRIPSRDPIEELQNRVANLEQLVQLLSANPNPSLPIYVGGDDPDDLYDGMIWLQQHGAELSFNYQLGDTTLTLQGQ